jgi:mono/diheme cytochrome c family protein
MSARFTLGLLLLLAGCDDMSVQPKQRAYSPAASPVTPPPGIVEFNAREPAVPAVSAALLTRGQERYRIFCAPCHAENGGGQGMIVQRGFPAPESFHTGRLRQDTSRQLYEVIGEGQGAMYSFAARIAPEDRWAIVAYVRALQRSQHVPLEQPQ